MGSMIELRVQEALKPGLRAREVTSVVMETNGEGGDIAEERKRRGSKVAEHASGSYGSCEEV
jgi:glutamate synthase domain-containing protein 2